MIFCNIHRVVLIKIAVWSNFVGSKVYKAVSYRQGLIDFLMCP